MPNKNDPEGSVKHISREADMEVAARKLATSDAPLVDEALQATRKASNAHLAPSAPDVLERELDKVAASASELASGAVWLAQKQTRSIANDVSDAVRRHPLAWVSAIGAVAFFLGATR